MRQGYAGIRAEVKNWMKNANEAPSKRITNVFLKKNPSRTDVLLLTKKFVGALISPKGTEAQINQLVLDAEALWLIIDAQSNFFKFTRVFCDSYNRVITKLINRYDGDRVDVKPALQQFLDAYHRNMKMGNSMPVKKKSVSNYLKNTAKKFKIRLTKIVGGKRVNRTENELKNAIAKKKNNM